MAEKEKERMAAVEDLEKDPEKLLALLKHQQAVREGLVCGSMG